jgi:putative FmdB family regulatory protein
MPIYAYRCEGCGFQKDALQKLSDPPLVDCPECGQPKLAKQLTAAGFALKGTGWYATDFKDKPATKPAAQESGAVVSPAPSTTAASAGSAASGSPAPAAASTAASPAAPAASAAASSSS